MIARGVKPETATRSTRKTAGMATERLVQVRDMTFRVHTTSRPGAVRAFVLVHGIGISHRAFARLHDVLAEEHTVHSLDMPGFDDLPEPERSPDVHEMASLLGEVVAGIGEQPVVVVGNSMGTQWAVELGVQRPDLVSHVVAVGPVVDDRHRSALRQGMSLGLDCLRETPATDLMVLTDYARCGPRWYARQLPHMLAYPMEERAGALERPLLVVRGGRDPIAGLRWCRRLRDAAPRARLVEMPGHPHLVQHTAPRAVASALQDFLATETAWLPAT
ncbi:alpha/beta fold hydrolase [Microbacterium oryzae]